MKYWAFHCNPNEWDLISELSIFNNGTWSINKQHQNKIQEGDKFFSWISGKEAGVYAFGEITKAPTIITDDLERVNQFATNPTRFQGEGLRVHLAYKSPILNKPIPKSIIIGSWWLPNPSLQYSFFEKPQGVSSQELTEDIYNHLMHLSAYIDSVHRFNTYLSAFHKNIGSSNEYMKMMPKIEAWFVEKALCDKDFVIWDSKDQIQNINTQLDGPFKDEWKNLNKENKNWYSAPWNKWVDFLTSGNKRRFWLYAPGENASKWDEFYQAGIMALGWDKLGNLNQYVTKEDIAQKLRDLDGTTGSKKNDATANYDFKHIIAKGDIIIAKRGTKEYLGYGVVESDYFYDTSKDTFQKCRKVSWKSKGNWPDENGQIVLKTLTDITKYPDYVNRLIQLLEIETESMNLPITNSKFPLNSIFYGPPGTGKTFNTINRALEILGQDLTGVSRNAVKKAFDEKVKEGQIVFTTFHQSMSYEDFIEGIKPKTENQEVLYEIEEGIFKSICNKARPSAGNFDDVIEAFKTEISEADGKSPLTINSKASNFNVIYRGTNVFYVQPHITTKKDPWYPVNILNIRKAFESDSFEGVYNPTYVREIINHLKIKKGLKKGNPMDALQNPYVLIIDEINRGNVSQIFGELITLIEEDKRLGKKEQLEITLPYSKVSFGVPENLYIIGTMNTADRSVEALDTALRRRFSFVEMPPQPSILSPAYQYWKLLWEYKDNSWEDKEFKSKEAALFDFSGASENLKSERKSIWAKMRNERQSIDQVAYFDEAEFTGVNLKKLLSIINQRIEKLLNKDYLVGHSFFIHVSSMEELLEAFQNKIIPLLQEYFYGDFGKIGLVLGMGFVREKSTLKAEELFASFDYEASAYDDKKIFELVDYSQPTDYKLKIKSGEVLMNFDKALRFLMKESIA